MAAAPIGDRVRVVWFRQPRCDFCAAPLAGTTYAGFACRDFVHDLGERCELPLTLLGYWAACARCAPDVRARRWRALARRVVDAAVAAGVIRQKQTRAARLELADLYGRLDGALTGDETWVEASGSARHCCEFAGWGVRPDVGDSVVSVEDGEGVLSDLRDLWTLACAECRQIDLLPIAREVELKIAGLR
jgi:hypothetical protein